MLSDPISDLCTRIRNAALRNHETLQLPHSKIKEKILEVLKEEGFIASFESKEDGHLKDLKVRLKYTDNGESVIRGIQRISKPGRRVTTNVTDLKPFLNGQGISILTTSKGVLSDRKCHSLNAGGEVLCRVW